MLFQLKQWCGLLADGWSGLSSNCVGDYTQTWASVPGAAKGLVALPQIFLFCPTHFQVHWINHDKTCVCVLVLGYPCIDCLCKSEGHVQAVL